LDPMRRKLFSLAAAVSPVLCAGVCVLWVRSALAADVLIYSRPGGRYHRVLSVGGNISWRTAPHYPYATGGLRWHRFRLGASYWNPPTTMAADRREWSVTPYAGEQPLIADHEFTVHYGVLAGPVVLGLGCGRGPSTGGVSGQRPAGAPPAATTSSPRDCCPECGAVFAAKGEPA
jgi:hypothetical protein